MDTDELKKLGAVPSDVLLISGRRSTVARAAQTTSEYSDQNLIQIDGITRDNAQVSVDEWCIVQKAPYRQAESVLLSPLEEFLKREENPDFSRFIVASNHFKEANAQHTLISSKSFAFKQGGVEGG